MNDDDLDHAFGRLASSLAPPSDAVARVGALVERRRRRRTTSVAVLSVVAVLGGGGIASAVAAGGDSTAPALTSATPSPRPPDLPTLPTQVVSPIPLTSVRPSPSPPALPELPTALAAIRCRGGVDVRRPFAAILLGGSPSIHGAVADQVRRSDTGLDILKDHADSAVVFADGPDGKRRVRLEVVHGFRGWVWITRRVCD